jgi:hypothetical protein
MVSEMSVWGPGVFDNDDALDWLYDLAETGSIARVSAALDVVLSNGSGELELADGHIALAAAEVVAALHGSIGLDLPEEVEEWVGDKTLPDDELRAKAEKAVHQILENSPVKSNWVDDEMHETWEKILQDLLRRLEA